MAESRRMSIYRGPTFSVDLEYNDKFFILHLPKEFKLSKDVLTDLLSHTQDLYLFAQTIGYEGVYCAIEVGNKVVNKLAARLGFELKGQDGTYNVYKLTQGDS